MRPLTPDQSRLRAGLAAAREQIVALLRSAVGDSLAPEQAQAMTREARAWRGANAFRLVRYLDDLRKELLRCFHDTALPMEVRVAAALVRLHALPLTRIVELTDDHIRHNQGTPT